jgi:hypothetical protein
MTQRGRAIPLEMLALPLHSSEDRPPRVVGFMAGLEQVEPEDAIRGLEGPMREAWIDIGKGCPPA